MYGFMGIWAIEIGEMASQKKWPQKKDFFRVWACDVSDNCFWSQFFLEAISPISMA